MVVKLVWWRWQGFYVLIRSHSNFKIQKKNDSKWWQEIIIFCIFIKCSTCNKHKSESIMLMDQRHVLLMKIIKSCSATWDRETQSRRVRGDLCSPVLPRWSLSTLNTGQDPGFEWQAASGHSYWPHSSLSPPSSTGLRGGSRCWSSRSGRLSPGPPGYLTPPQTCCCPPPSSQASSLRGSPHWPHTAV